MSFQWITLLWFLLFIPVLAGAYILAQKRRRKYALRFSSLALVKDALGRGPGIRRHIPPAIFLTALALLLVALARPTATVMLPAQRGMIILAIDSSGSMRAEDVQPSRMEAAKAAARAFVQRQPKSTRIGVVSFAGSASLVQPPTRDHDEVIAAIDRLTMQRATAIGSGIITSLNAILEDFGEQPIPLYADEPPIDGIPLGGGEWAPAIIVLLSDGQNTTGPMPLDVVDQASTRKVRIYTVGLGSPDGTILNFYNRSIRVRLDEDTLKKIADRTDGKYFKADTETSLIEIYERLSSEIIFRPQKIEVTALFAAVSALMMTVAGGLSLLWFSRLP